MENFEIEVTVRGPKTTEGKYPNRETLAELKLEAPGLDAFEVYRRALEALTKPRCVVVNEPGEVVRTWGAWRK